ncbi:MAG: Tll0287-like domain-containing protein [Sulfurovaceae bacterium]
MKKLMILPITFMLAACTDTCMPKQETNNTINASAKIEAIKAKGIAQADGLISAIKPALMQSLNADPTGESGMMVCANAAMPLTDNYNAQLPADSKVRRTALKYRNPANKPDTKDIEVMNKIIASKNLAAVAVEMDDSYRVYKPLPMAQPCMACHGDLKTMNEQTKEKIKEYYPRDLATGFKLGEFRGVIVSEIKK